MSVITTVPVSSDPSSRSTAGAGEANVLVIAWSAQEPSRVGEIAVLATGYPQVLGRGEDPATEPRIRFFRQRPGSLLAGPPLAGTGLSRRQLTVVVQDGVLTVQRIGRCPLHVNGAPCDHAVLKPGDTLYLRRQLVLMYTRRAALIPEGRHFVPASWGEFGEPDSHGILGESPATWRLREQLAFVAKSGTHALLVGPSGSGKELAARAIHGLSDRRSGAFVARSAATIPPGLIDAELFGSAKNYPNAGMPERRGLVGEADGGTLFLDEIGELPVEQQAHLLRVLDGGGEYQRLGEAVTRRADFRLVGATNRDPATLKHDLRARFTSVVDLVPLASRREDIPLLARHLLLAAAKKSPDVAGRFVVKDSSGRQYVRFEPSFIEQVLREPLETNARQLDAVLWKGMYEATGDAIQAPWAGASGLAALKPQPSPRRPEPGSEPTVPQIRAALDSADGSVTKAARGLGLSSRFALYRLMRKHGIRADAPDKFTTPRA
jgi:DNA-binding NtrC family response regulator